MRDLIELSLTNRQEYICSSQEIVKKALLNFFENTNYTCLSFVINLPDKWNTYRDNPIVDKWKIEDKEGHIYSLSNLPIKDKSILGDLNLVFINSGIGLISLFRQGLIKISYEDVKEL